VTSRASARTAIGDAAALRVGRVSLFIDLSLSRPPPPPPPAFAAAESGGIRVHSLRPTMALAMSVDSTLFRASSPSSSSSSVHPLAAVGRHTNANYTPRLLLRPTDRPNEKLVASKQRAKRGQDGFHGNEKRGVVYCR